ncbi:MAG TPA: hypothetical protein VGM03_23575 [Phycisphaerae bacterium]|jgi:hypothetical protein
MITTQAGYLQTKVKLADLRDMIAAIERRPTTSPETRSATLISLRRFANQLAEEIIRYEIDHGLPRSSVRELVETQSD